MLRTFVLLFVATFCNGDTITPLGLSEQNCSLRVNNTFYDLSVLSLRNGDSPWIVKSSLIGSATQYFNEHHQQILLNVCAPVPKLSDELASQCTNGTSKAAICLLGNNKTTSLGEFNNYTIRLNDDSGLTLTYFGPGVVSKINLFCKPGDLSSHPKLVSVKQVTNTHVYTFEWDTGAACPRTTIVGNGCTVHIKDLDISFNLAALQKLPDLTISHEDYDYVISVCGELKEKHCGNLTAGACQKRKNAESYWSLGKPNSSLKYENGHLKLEYTDGSPYRTQIARKSEIIFICDPEEFKDKVKFVKETNETYYFEISTKYACPHFTSTVRCLWENGTHLYDLSPLSNPDSNHIAPLRNGSLIFINICRPLNRIEDHNVEECCGVGTSACLIGGKGGNKCGLNLGRSLKPPVGTLDGSLILAFENGERCPSSSSTANITSLIKFVCDQDAQLGTPEFREVILNDNDCVYTFEWRTNLLCNPESISPDNECKFVDSRTGLTADLKSLRRKPNDAYRIRMSREGKQELSINICNDANTFKSPECHDAAVCLNNGDNTYLNLGKKSHETVKFDGSSLWFYFKNGSKCDDEKFSSSLQLICDKNATNGSPVFDGTEDCRTNFKWKTNTVCNLSVTHPCTLLTKDHFYDLRLLSSGSHAWSANDTKTGNVYWINVCHKLPREVNCWSYTSSICGCLNGMDCKYDLGSYNAAKLGISENKDLVLTYSGGYIPHCAHEDVSTKIIFKCGTSRGNPKFVSFENCTYTFQWDSFVACPVNDSSEEILEEGNGYVYSKRYNSSISVKSFFEKQFNVTGYNIHTEDTYNYLINLSNATVPLSKNCKTASVCQSKKDFYRDIGSYGSHQFVMKNRNLELRLYSSNHQKCGKNSQKNVTSIFMLECTEEHLKDPLFFYESNNCDYIFTWGSKDICKWVLGRVTAFSNRSDYEHHERHASKPMTHTSSSHSSSVGMVILCVSLICVLSLFGFVILKKESMARIAQTVRNTLQPRWSPSFHYSNMTSDTAKLVAAEYQTNETLESLAA